MNIRSLILAITTVSLLSACTAGGIEASKYETRALPSGKTISVMSIAPDKDKSLVLTYISATDLKDRVAVDNDVAEVWVPFKEEVEKGGYKSATIAASTPRTGVGLEVTKQKRFDLVKNADGSWLCATAPSITTDEVLYSKTRADLHVGNFDAARVTLDKLIEDWPNSSVALALRGICYLALEQPKNALKDLDKAIQLDPSNADFYANRGDAYSQLGDNSRALVDLDKAVSLTPNSYTTLLTRGEVLLLANKPKQAIIDLTKAIALNEKSGEAYFHRAEANEKIGDMKQAKKDLETAAALKYNPNDTVEQR